MQVVIDSSSREALQISRKSYELNVASSRKRPGLYLDICNWSASLFIDKEAGAPKADRENYFEMFCCKRFPLILCFSTRNRMLVQEYSGSPSLPSL